MPNPNAPAFCRAFTDHKHRYAFSRTTAHDNDVYECACGQPQIDATDADVLVINENTDFASLPFMLGYDVDDYPLHIQKAAYIDAKDGDIQSIGE